MSTEGTENTDVSGLSDNNAAALAYITILPAIILLLLAPYNTKAFIRFNAFQSIGLYLCILCLCIIMIIPFLGWLIAFVGSIAAVVLWIMAIVNAAKGQVFKIPVIGQIAANMAHL